MSFFTGLPPVPAALQTPLSLSNADAFSGSPTSNTIWCHLIQQYQGQCPKGDPRNNELHFSRINLTPTSEADADDICA
ncbi:hypothetical protein BDW75DRAFT_225385 [Aspergillus navahoensis]